MNILILLLLVVIEITIIFKEPKDKSDDDVSETPTGARAYRMRGLFHLIIGCVCAVVSSVLRRLFIPDSISDKILIAIYNGGDKFVIWYYPNVLINNRG